ncbi:hypothetical protein INT08_10525 [Prosthecochloris sp. N3]|uniref:Uncharacterized protein n=1 Tax=Prosthecochloris ethylica TaxID=2743976 RepID=A0ABR9XUK6_9CHLB|nr:MULTISPECIES: hypothetical protein [Prosthecochloris]MBF0587397.1 hypothetical protein [Prosthecochloris ethylica]MBF0637603.1 hypothetical protein [Prosthecochloris ethylica]NUK48630.1 hypothetical protein [Prosthecochloris ethylica]RNA65355.1 hypothetical protein CR163_009080 [Prosthecochloris sp. ZM_2]
MLSYSFKTLWNRTFLAVGPVWFLLVYAIWSSGQLENLQDRLTFLGIVIPGFILTYVSGFLIEKWHKKKKKQGM